MSDTNLTQLLNRLDSSTEPLDEYAIFTEICRLRPEITKTLFHDDFFEASAEALAFGVDEPFDRSDAEAGGLFGSLREGGAWGQLRDKHRQILDYWAQRARAATHAVLRARYAGLVWELGDQRDIQMAHTRIDAVVTMSRVSCHKSSMVIFAKLEHALVLAIKINDEARTEAVRDAIIAFEQQVANDGQLGTWGRAFDSLFENKKSRITDEQRQKLILDLEARLERISDTAAAAGVLDPHGARAAAQRLARHYRRCGQTEDIKRVLAKVERAFEIRAAKLEQPLLAQVWLGDVEKLYRNFGCPEEASRVRMRIRELGPAAYGQLIGIPYEFQITKEEMDDYVNKMLEGDEETVFRRFILHYIPSREQTEERVKELNSTTTQIFPGNRTVMDSKGRPAFSLGSLQDDLEGHIFSQTKQDIGFSSIFMRHVLEAIISRFGWSADDVLRRIDQSPVFDRSKRVILERALKSYFEKDALLFLHLAVPQVEAAVRELAGLLGVDTYRPNQAGGMDLRNMDDLLQKERIVEELARDVADYFRVLYTDTRGINLRNHLCHGMLPGEAFHFGLADRVFHTLLILTVFKANPPTDDEPNPGKGAN